MAKKYDSTRDSITGDKLMVFIKNGEDILPVAFGTSCNVDMSADTIDTSNKMSGNWKEYLTGQLGWTVSSDSLLSTKTGHMSFQTLKKLMADRTPLPIVIGKAVADATEGDFTQGEEFVKGEAIITSLNMTASNNEICTSSVTLQGTGELEDGTPAVTP